MRGHLELDPREREWLAGHGPPQHRLAGIVPHNEPVAIGGLEPVRRRRCVTGHPDRGEDLLAQHGPWLGDLELQAERGHHVLGQSPAAEHFDLRAELVAPVQGQNVQGGDRLPPIIHPDRGLRAVRRSRQDNVKDRGSDAQNRAPENRPQTAPQDIDQLGRARSG